MKKVLDFVKICLFTSLIVLIFINIKSINESISLSFTLWKENIFPSLFPFFLISNILIQIGFVEFFGNILYKPLYFLFKIKKECSFIFIMSMLSGFPSSAKYIDNLLENKLITQKDAEKVLMFTFFSNPLFIINTIGIMFFNDIKTGIIILISHYLGNIVIGVAFRNFNVARKLETSIPSNTEKINIIKIILNAIVDSLKTLVLIFGIITAFLITISIVSSLFNSSLIFKTIISSLLEITSGLKLLTMTNLSLKIKIVLSTCVLSFGGLSIHAQMFSILSKHKIRYKYFLLSRIIHVLLSIIITVLLLKMGDLF